MRYIKKSDTEPLDLRTYKRNCRKASPPLKITYKDMPKDGTRSQLATDQGYLCAYCMRRINLESADQNHYLHIEHLVPQNQLTDEEATNFSNFLGVCPGNRDAAENSEKTCDAYRGSLDNEQQTMHLNPLDAAQMETIYYLRNGEIDSTDNVLSAELSDKLNLNGDATYLKQNRATAYRKLIKALSDRKPQTEWTQNRFLKRHGRCFVCRTKTVLIRNMSVSTNTGSSAGCANNLVPLLYQSCTNRTPKHPCF